MLPVSAVSDPNSPCECAPEFRASKVILVASVEVRGGLLVWSKIPDARAGV